MVYLCSYNSNNNVTYSIEISNLRLLDLSVTNKIVIHMGSHFGPIAPHSIVETLWLEAG